MKVNGYEIKAHADLYSANLRGADLRGADLRGADLQYANLQNADLQYANLQYANLQSARLQSAYLRDAKLRHANLRDTDLRDVNLKGADLRNADLRDADLRGADLQDTKLPPLSILPAGDITGWKKTRDNVIVKLLIPADAKRSNATGRKCRAEYAVVTEICDASTAYSRQVPEFTYRAGRTVRPELPFDEDWTKECASGIHFFITREEAEDH